MQGITGIGGDQVIVLRIGTGAGGPGDGLLEEAIRTPGGETRIGPAPSHVDGGEIDAAAGSRRADDHGRVAVLGGHHGTVGDVGRHPVDPGMRIEIIDPGRHVAGLIDADDIAGIVSIGCRQIHRHDAVDSRNQVAAARRVAEPARADQTSAVLHPILQYLGDGRQRAVSGRVANHHHIVLVEFFDAVDLLRGHRGRGEVVISVVVELIDHPGAATVTAGTDVAEHRHPDIGMRRLLVPPQTAQGHASAGQCLRESDGIVGFQIGHAALKGGQGVIDAGIAADAQVIGVRAGNGEILQGLSEIEGGFAEGDQLIGRIAQFQAQAARRRSLGGRQRKAGQLTTLQLDAEVVGRTGIRGAGNGVAQTTVGQGELRWRQILG